MALQKVTYVDNQTVITAEQMNAIQDAIVELETYVQSASGRSNARIAEVELLASSWVGTATPYSQVVNIPGVTENSQVDLTPDVEQLSIFYEKDLTFVTENDGGVVTVYAIGQKPTNDYVIQVTITEVSA